MATQQQIESAAQPTRAPVGSGMDTMAQHILNLARADDEREAQDRVWARRFVQRCGGDDVAELLAALGLDEPEDRPESRMPCKVCEEMKPLSAFHRKAGRAPSLECKDCANARHRQQRAEASAPPTTPARTGEVTHKECTRCHVVKPVKDFTRDTKAPDGRAWQCSVCTREQSRRWRQRNPPEEQIGRDEGVQ